MLATAPGWFHALEAPAHVTVASVRELVDAVTRELDAGKRRVVLDLRRTEAIDGVALAAIVGLYKRAAAQGSTLLLRGPRPAVRCVLAVTRLESLVMAESGEELRHAAE